MEWPACETVVGLPSQFAASLFVPQTVAGNLAASLPTGSILQCATSHAAKMLIASFFPGGCGRAGIRQVVRCRVPHDEQDQGQRQLCRTAVCIPKVQTQRVLWLVHQVVRRWSRAGTHRLQDTSVPTLSPSASPTLLALDTTCLRHATTHKPYA